VQAIQQALAVHAGSAEFLVAQGFLHLVRCRANPRICFRRVAITPVGCRRLPLQK
jgi:hypothetical protein